MEALKNRFREWKMATKSVLFHFRQFVWFFVVLFIIQSLFLLVMVSSSAKVENVTKRITESYSHHMVVRFANKTQTAYLKQNQKFVFADDHIYDVVSVVNYGDASSSDPRSDVYIRFFGEDKQMACRLFLFYHQNTMESLGDFDYELTPLYEVQSYRSRAAWSRFAELVCAFLISVLALAALFNTRIRNDRFDTGIYMTFGADRKRLAKQSFGEMEAISLLTLIPSLVFSLLIGGKICRSASIPFRFGFWDFVLLLILTALVNFFAVFLPVKSVSKQKPIRLLASQDNSDLILSPRISVNLPAMRGSYVRRLTSVGRRRFFRYRAVLLCTTVLFAALSVGIFTLSDLSAQKEEFPMPQYRLSFSAPYSYNDYASDLIRQIDGIDFVEKKESARAIDLKSHVLFEKEQIRKTSEAVKTADGRYATDRVNFNACDEEGIGSLSRYAFDGDPSLLLTEKKQVIVSDSMKNAKALSLSPGDKVTLAFYLDRMYEPAYALEDLHLLKFRLEAYHFTYEEFTVCAVIHDQPSGNNLDFYFSGEDYSRAAGMMKDGEFVPAVIRYEEAYLYPDPSLGEAELDRLHNDLLRVFESAYPSSAENPVFVEDLHAAMDRELDSSGGSSLVYRSVGVLTMLLPPVICFFSQSIFYRKRRQEFTLLRAMGSTGGEIRSIHLTEGAFSAAVAVLLDGGLTLAISRVIFLLYNGSAGLDGIRVIWKMPWIPFAVSLLLVALSVFLSSFLPALSFANEERKKDLGALFGE